MERDDFGGEHRMQRRTTAIVRTPGTHRVSLAPSTPSQPVRKNQKLRA